MFDPTAFDNMKVVIEGALYDLDLSGEIIITDRNDFLNSAKMSRCFDVSFKLPDPRVNFVTVKLEIQASLINLASELLPDSLVKHQSGCTIRLHFLYQNVTKEKHFIGLHNLLLGIWGEDRKITQTVIRTYPDSRIENVSSIEFGRLIQEDQLDDLIDMIDFMLTTAGRLETYLSENL